VSEVRRAHRGVGGPDLTIPITISVAVQGAGGTLVAAVVWALLTGRLMTATMVDRIIAGYVESSRQKDELVGLWREGYHDLRRANETMAQLTKPAAAVGETAMNVIKSISPEPAPAPPPAQPATAPGGAHGGIVA
jgi:hypothetical protein